MRPDLAEVHNNRGLALHALKRYEEALASYDRAIKLRPHYAEAHNNRGLIVHELKRYGEASGKLPPRSPSTSELCRGA